MTKPKLRFKDKNGNAYPEWEENLLGDIGELRNGIAKGSEFFGHGHKFINLQDVFGKDCLYNDDYDLVETSEKERQLNDLKKGDVIFVRSSVKPSGVGLPSVVMEDLKDTVFSGFLIRFREHKLCLNLLYKRYCFIVDSFRREVLKRSSSSANTNINQDNLANIKLKIPCLEEQEKIAGFLSKVDELINECEGEVKDLEEQKKGLMQKIFSQQIRFKDSNNDPYPDWKEKKIEDIATLTSSKRIHASDYVPKGIPFYRGKEITELKTNKKISELLYISEDIYDEYKMKYGAPQKNDILVTAVGTLGNVWAVDNEYPFYFKDGNLIWFKYVKENSKFIEYLLLSPKGKKKLLNSAIGSNQKALTIVGINKLHFKFPCQEEQEKIAKVLSKIDELIEEKKELLSDWQQFKKGLLQQMFV